MMITYNWKAEFSEPELKTIEHHRQIRDSGSESIVAEMANALDRYEGFLNEQEFIRDHHQKMSDELNITLLNSEIIKQVLTTATGIFCWEFERDNKTTLTYDEDGMSDRITLTYDNDSLSLVRNISFGGKVYKPLSDIEKITFAYCLNAWEVIWKTKT